MSEVHEHELVFGSHIYPVPLHVEVHSVHYADTKDTGVFIRVRGDLDHIIDDGSVNLFLTPDGFKGLLRSLVEALVIPFDQEVAESGLSVVDRILPEFGDERDNDNNEYEDLAERLTAWGDYDPIVRDGISEDEIEAW